MPGNRSGDLRVLRSKNQYIFRYYKGCLTSIKKRLFKDAPASRGGGYYWNKTIWHRSAYKGKLSQRAKELLASEGMPEHLQETD